VKHTALATLCNFRKKGQRDELASQLEKLANELQHQMACVTQYFELVAGKEGGLVVS